MIYFMPSGTGFGLVYMWGHVTREAPPTTLITERCSELWLVAVRKSDRTVILLRNNASVLLNRCYINIITPQ